MNHGAEHMSGAVQNGLAIFYLLAFALNLGFAAYCYYGWRSRNCMVKQADSTVWRLNSP